jgi:hypothetical protein
LISVGIGVGFILGGLVAFVLGLYALHLLSLVHEKGEVPGGVVYREFLGETRRMVRNLSSIGGPSHFA